MNAPNLLTLLRLVLAIPFFVLISGTPRTWAYDAAFVLFVITALTDVLDGYLARKYHITSKLGRVLDPMSDKVLICGGFILLIDPAGGVPAWMVAAIVIRELVVNSLRAFAEGGGKTYAAIAAGKIKMACESITIMVILLFKGTLAGSLGDATLGPRIVRIFMWVTVLVVASSGYGSLRRSLPHLREARTPDT